MKKIALVIGAGILAMAACSSDGSKTTQDTTGVWSQTNNGNQNTADTIGNTGSGSASSEFQKGKDLIAKSDCIGCHKDYEKLVGPAYVDVAKKYEATDANITSLSEKVIAGGQGVWGEIPMTPHPTVSKDDAAEMVKYILSLK